MKKTFLVLLKEFKRSNNDNEKNILFKEMWSFFEKDVSFITKKYTKDLDIDRGDLNAEFMLLFFKICKGYTLKTWINTKKFRAYLLKSFHNLAWIKYNQRHNTLKNKMNKTISIYEPVSREDESDNCILSLLNDEQPDFTKKIEQRDIILKLLNRLDKKYHIIIKMIMQGYTYKDIADKYKLNRLRIYNEKAIKENVPVTAACIKQIIDRKIKPELIKIF